jgi:DNA-binding MarR family transcriptional regulator
MAKGNSSRPKAAGSGPRIGKSDYEALAEFRYTLRRFLAFSQSAAREAGLTAQQHQALLAIKGCPGGDQVTVSELAGRLLLRHHSVVELIDRLARLGLVLRRVDPADRRRVLVSLSAKAEHLLDGMSATHLEEIRRLGPSLAALVERFGKP